MEEKVEYWLELAQYDLDTAKVMLNGKRYYMLALCAIKLLKKR